MRLVKNRPFIALTILYCAVLVVLNQRGFFVSPPKHDVALLIAPSYTEVTGRVTDIFKEYNSKQIFTVKASDVDGHPCGGTLLVHSSSKNDRAEEGDIVRFHCALLRPPPARNPGGFDYAAYLRRMNIYAVAYISYFMKIDHKPLPFYIRLAEATHRDMTETILKALPPAESAVLIPMLIGDKQSLPIEEKRAFTDAGVMHILVVSGLKVAYVAGTFLLLFRLTGFKRRLASLLTIPFLLLYMVITGDNPPVVRATIMAVSIFISLSLKRESLTYQALALAAAVILIFDPQALFTASFQLSFSATIGIVYLFPYLIKPFQKFPWWFRNPVGGTVAVCLASQLGVMPLLAFYFHKIFIAGIVSNIPIVPLTGIITGMGIVLYLVHFISGPLTLLMGCVISLLIKLLLAQVHYFAGLPYATMPAATPSLWAVALYYCFLWGIVQLRRIKYMPLILGAGGALVFAGLFIHHHAVKTEMEITSLYAGNGTAVHVTFPGNSHWLIDCGRERDGKRTVCPYLWSKGVQSIDKIIITSDDKRHSGGLKAVTDNFTVPDIIYPFSIPKQKQYFVNGSTVTVIPSGPEELTVLIDFAGKRIVFAREDKLPEEAMSRNIDVLHISCRRRSTTIRPLIDTAKPGAVILSGTVPDDTPDTGRIYPLNYYGAVSCKVTSKGIRVKVFNEASHSITTDDNS